MGRSSAVKLSFSSDSTQTVPTAATHPCTFYGFALGMDGSNDVSITVFDSGTTTTTNMTEIVPTNTYDATALGLNGCSFPQGITCNHGIAVTASAVSWGACEVTVYYG